MISYYVSFKSICFIVRFIIRKHSNHHCFIAKCCSSMIVSAAEPVKSRISDTMGQYKFYLMDSNGRPIYSNSNRTKYIYVDADNDWAVSYEFKWYGEPCPFSLENNLINNVFTFFLMLFFRSMSVTLAVIYTQQQIYIIHRAKKNVQTPVLIIGNIFSAKYGELTILLMFHVVRMFS